MDRRELAWTVAEDARTAGEERGFLRAIRVKVELYDFLPDYLWDHAEYRPDALHIREFGRRIRCDCENGAKLVITLCGLQPLGEAHYLITVQEGTLPDNLPYLVRLCGFERHEYANPRLVETLSGYRIEVDRR